MTISRRDVLRSLPVLLSILAPDGARAQRPARVGWLSYVGHPDPGLESLRAGLQELGHVEGRSYVVLAKFANGDFTRLPGLVEEFAAEGIDVLVTRGPSTDSAKLIRAKVPVVFAYSGDPVESGFAKNLARPGLNMTGITFMALELSAKRVEVLKALVPGATKIALLSNPEHAGELAEYRVNRARIPTMYGWTEYVEAGGLVSYGPGLTENFPILAKFTDRILKGADANTLPIEQVSRIRLVLNMATARRMGFTVPPEILARADRVIE